MTKTKIQNKISTTKVSKQSASSGMKTDIYNTKGKKEGDITLPKSVFAISMNKDLLHQVVVSMQSNARTNVAHVKDRSEVAGGGKKPWKQKGTGRARHGSSRSPIWRGGGITFGPRNERNFNKKINKKMRIKALCMALSSKLDNNEIIFVDSLGIDTPKTAEARKIIDGIATIKGVDSIATKKHNVALFVTAEKDVTAKKSFNNFGNIKVVEVQNMNPVDVLEYKYIVVVNPKDSVKIIEDRVGGTTTKVIKK